MPISSINSSMRIGGLASGLDTESMVKSLMQIEQLKVDRVIQQRTMLEWQQSARQEINNLITEFRTETMSALSPLTNLNTAMAYHTFKVNMADGNNSVTVSTHADALAGSYVIDSVEQLASAALVKSVEGFKLESLNMSATLAESSLGFTFGGQDSNELSYMINGKIFKFDSSTTLRSMFSTINNSAAGVEIRFSELNGSFTLASKSTGVSSQLELNNISGNAFGDESAMGLSSLAVTGGMDAKLTINGIEVTRSENLFLIDGIRYNLVATSAVPLRFTVERDIDPTVDRIKSFVEKYNTMIGKFQDKLSEERFRGFQPLTDLQKESMSEKEIEIWDLKAQSGLMRNDRSLSSLLGQMRSLIFESVAGVEKNLTAIGITTASYHERGQLHIDETALRKALTDNPDQVMKLFMQESNDNDPAVRHQNSGLISRMRDAFSNFSSQFRPARYAEDLIKLNKRISDLNQSLKKREDTYWRKFSAMEQALSSMYAQSSWLTQNLGL